jgi:hypothetical protein
MQTNKKKYEYHKDVNCTPLPKDFIADQKRRSLKYTKGGNK